MKGELWWHELVVVLTSCGFCRNQIHKQLIQSQMEAERWNVSVGVMYPVLPCL